MSLPNAGPISFSQIQTIMGGTPPVSMSEYYTNANQAYTSGVSGIPALGNMISVSMFLGKTNNAGFSPTTISGLGLWLDANDYSTFTFSGSNVIQWNDKSGNSRHFENSTTFSQPTYENNSFNNKPCINTLLGKFLNRTASTMGTLASSLTSSIFVVGETDFNYTWNIFLTNWFDVSGSTSVNRFHCSFRNNTTNLLTLYANAALQSSTGTTATNSRYVACFVYAGNGATCTSSLNGVASSFTGNGNLPNSSTSGTSIFAIGDGRTLNYSCKKIAEVIMYDRNLTTTERLSVESYLMNKYSVAPTYTYNNLSAGSISACRAIYAFKLHNSSYTGPIIQLRRSSDNNLQNFYADAYGNLGSAFLLNLSSDTTYSTWLGNDTAYVSILYDQSGNGKNLSQASTSLQPQFIYKTASEQSYIYLYNKATLSGNNVFSTSTVTNMQTIFRTREISRTNNITVSFNGLNGAYDNNRTFLHTPWSTGLWYWAPGTGTDYASTSSGFVIGDRIVTNAYKSASENRSGLRLSQQTWNYSSTNPTANVSNLYLNADPGGATNFNADHWFYGMFVFDTRLTSADESLIETSPWS